jgi:hypothetical protein
VVVAKGPLAENLAAAVPQRGKKPLGLRNSRDGQHTRASRGLAPDRSDVPVPSGDRERRFDGERRLDAGRVVRRTIRQQRVRTSCGTQRFAQPAGGKDALLEIGGADHQQIDVACQPQMLEPVVEQQHGGAEPADRERSGQKPIR